MLAFPSACSAFGTLVLVRLQPLPQSTLTTARTVLTENSMQCSGTCWCRFVSTTCRRLRKRIINQPGLHETASNKTKQLGSSIPSTQDAPVSPGGVGGAGEAVLGTKPVCLKLSVTEPQCGPQAQCPRELRQMMLAFAFLPMVPIIFPEKSPDPCTSHQKH